MTRELRTAGGARTLVYALGTGLALMVGSGCGMYGDLMLEERPVRTPEIIELEPISAPPESAPDAPASPAIPTPEATEPGDEDEDGGKNEDAPAGGS